MKRCFCSLVRKHLLFVASFPIESVSALAFVVRHGADAAVLALDRAGPVAAIGAAEAVRTGANIVANTQASIGAAGLTRN